MRSLRANGILAAMLVFGIGAWTARTACPEAADNKAKAEEAKAHAEAVKRALDVFEVEYKAKEEPVRVAAVERLGQVQDKKVLDRLSRLLQGPDTDAVKTQAVRVVAAYAGDKNAARILSSVLVANKKKPEMQVVVVEAMGDLGDRSLIPVLIDLYREKSLPVAKAAILASAKIRDKACVEPLLKMLREFEEQTPAIVTGTALVTPAEDERAQRKAELLDPAQRALSDITLQSFSTYKEWDAWWRKNKGTFKTESDAAK